MFLRVNISYDSVVDHLGEHSLRIQVLGARNLRQKDTFLPQVMHFTRAFCPRARPNMPWQPARVQPDESMYQWLGSVFPFGHDPQSSHRQNGHQVPRVMARREQPDVRRQRLVRAQGIQGLE